MHSLETMKKLERQEAEQRAKQAQQQFGQNTDAGKTAHKQEEKQKH